MVSIVEREFDPTRANRLSTIDYRADAQSAKSLLRDGMEFDFIDRGDVELHRERLKKVSEKENLTAGKKPYAKRGFRGLYGFMFLNPNPSRKRGSEARDWEPNRWNFASPWGAYVDIRRG